MADMSTVVQIVGAVSTLLVGIGGLSAWAKIRWDRKQGVAQLEAAEDEALAKHWMQMIETQARSLVDPMQSRLERLEKEVTLLRADLDASRKKYWAAVSYIRTMSTWIDRHVDRIDETTTIPQPPHMILEDV